MKKMKLEELLAKNLTYLMGKTPDLDTVAKLAARSKVGGGTVGRLKNAESSATIDTISKLASAFGISPTRLLSDDIERPEEPQQAAMQASAAPLIQWVTQDEAQLLSRFRGTDDEGRDTIKKISSMVKAVIHPPPDLPQ